MFRISVYSLFITAIIGVLIIAPHPGSVSGAVPTGSATIANFASGITTCTPHIEPVTLDNPTVVTTCTRDGIQQALDQGGQIAFDCGSNPVTIPIDTPLQTNGSTTTIDGGGLITLDGQNKSKILVKPFSEGNNTLTIQNMRFINARAPSSGEATETRGGAITSGHPGTRLHIINTTFENNATTDTSTADNQGGAIYSHNSYETVIVNSVFQDNVSGSGGAIGVIASGMLIFNSRFVNNQAIDTTEGGVVRGYGGALHLDGVTNNYNPDSNRILHVCGSVFEGNTAIRGGGATASVVSDNKGTKAIFEQSTFRSNETKGRNGEGGQGGAIYHIEDDEAGGYGEDNLEISASTFTGNKVLKQGGAVWLLIHGNGTIVNSTFEGNTTTAPKDTVGQGGAMAITLGKITLTNVTFANNHAAYQAGALHGGGANDPNRVITLRNTIFLNNTLNVQEQPSSTKWQGYHTNRSMNDGGNNIQYPEERPFYENTQNNNITDNPIYVNPLLEDLADNGGPTLTMALQENSPAIDAGRSNGCPDTDQRGVTRPQGSGCDIGAYESGAAEPPPAGPVLENISPSVIAVDTAADMTLTITGRGFTESSVVRWNGEDRPTTYVSETQLTAEIAAADVNTTGDFAVTVYDPNADPEFTESEARSFNVVDNLLRLYLPLVRR